MSAKDRYVGRPFLILLESYVLLAIGELPLDRQKKLVAMEPQLRQLYMVKGEWHDIVSLVMDLPDSLPAEIRIIWAKNQAKALAHGEVLKPQDFVEMFVDKNFLQ